MTEVKERRRTCGDHCAGCDQHFSGLGAFDAHRRGGYCGEPETMVVEKTGRRLLQVWTEAGYCERSPGCWRDGKLVAPVFPVTIWQTYKTEEQQLALLALAGGSQ